MDREKSSIVRSKSSNNGLHFKTDKKNTKSISDGDFTPNLVKKLKGREKTANSLHTEAYQIRRKPPPRPRPGQKKFLTSVLTILSKSTTGTQYPDIKEKDTKTNKRLNRHERYITTEKPKRQGKYKSRILNRNTDKSDQFIVLQSKKDIAQTPSNYSETITANDLQKDKPNRSIRDMLDNNIYKTVAEGVSNALADKITKRSKKITINDDPETLASKTADEDKKFYNLFVDLLESTFNKYNLDNDVLSDTNSDLKINESVAKKLAINNEIESNNIALTVKKDTTLERKVFDQPIEIKISDHKPIKRIKPRLSVKSFVKPKKFDIPQAFSFQSKRKIKHRKKNLLNIFKEELQFKPTFEEPRNLFQALKVLAKNKKVHVIEKPENFKSFKIDTDDFDSRECKLKTRKIISMKTKKYTKTLDRDKIIQRYSEYNSKIKKRDKSPTIPASHSLEIFEYNYEEPKLKTVYQTKRKENQNVGVVPKSSPFVMRSNLDYYTLLKFPDRSSYDFTY